MNKLSGIVLIICSIAASSVIFQNCQKSFQANNVIVGADGSILPESVSLASNHIESCLVSQAGNPIQCAEINTLRPADSCTDNGMSGFTATRVEAACPRGPALLGRCYATQNGVVASAYVYDRAFLYPDPTLGAQVNQALVDQGKIDCPANGGTWEDL